MVIIKIHGLGIGCLGSKGQASGHKDCDLRSQGGPSIKRLSLGSTFRVKMCNHGLGLDFECHLKTPYLNPNCRPLPKTISAFVLPKPKHLF